MRNDIKRFFIVVLAACGLAVSAANVAAVPLTLIPESGDARCAIVVDPAVMASGSSTTGLVNPALEAEKQRIRLRDSVQDLAAVLKKMTGREVPVVTGPAPAGKTPIFIGSSARAVFGPVGVSAPFQQGMRVVVDAGKGVGLYGESMLADSYAVYTFLDQLGCRWFMPGELGEIIPQKAELVVEEVDLQDAPYTVYRGGSGYGFDDVFMRRNRMGGVLPPTQHCLESGYISQQEKKQHPEWIAEYADGTPMPNRLKWSNKELANRIGDIIAERQRTSPQFFYCLSPDDGAVFDQSEEDKALDAGDFDPTFQMISITDRAVTFYNRIVERAVSKHPDLLFSALAYVQYTRPPLRERPHSNLVIQLAPITYSRAHPMNMDEVPDNTALRYIISGWGDASQAMSYYFYAYYLADPVSSAPFLRKWAVDIPYIYKHGSCRYWQPETMGNNEFFFMAQWMAQRMAWNPEQDPWALYREANDAMYGPAAETMWAFWNAVDKCWVETPEYSGAGWGHINRFTPERVAEISALIAQAANEAGTGPARERVRLAETSWKLTSDFTQLRRDLAEGRWTDLDTRSQAWKKTVSQAAIASGDHRCYAWCWFGADKTFGGQYYDWFYSRTHASAQNIATNATLLVAKPVRDFRWKAVERGAPDTEGFSTPGFNDSAWPTTDVALQTWSSLGLHNHMGSMWYRTTIDVAQPQSGKKVWLWVGSTDGSVKAFVNGQAVQGGVVPRTGETFKPVDEPSSYGAPMRFDVTSVIRPGANSIALFATRGAGPNEIGTGGLLSPVVVYGEYMNTAGGTTNVNFTALTQSVGEGGGKVTVTLQLSEVAAEDVTVPLVLSGTAVAGSDFLSFPTSATISAGATNATFDIALVDDTLFEATETLVLTMGEPTHAVPGYPSTHTILILDNDSVNKPAVRFTSESQSVAAGSTATLGVSLTKASGADTTIDLLFEGTATNNLDYTVDKTSVTIPAGETEATVSFKLLKRAAGKTVIASIKDSSNADMGAPRIHTLTIAASEAPPPALPTAAFASATQTVQENAGTVSISVVLSQASSSAVSIPFTLGGTALAGADYQIPASPLTIPAGQTSGTINIVLAADGLAEPAETIIVELGTPTGATLGATTTHTLTIAASEATPPPALAAPSYQATLTVQGYAEDKEPLENFPVLVRLSPQTVAGFHYGICKADGSDIVFVDENGEPLPYQLDTWNPPGESLFWVKLPQLAKGKTFFVQWGDSQSNVDSARSAATWNANYGAVWHMGEASGVCANSTSHGSAYDATPMGETTESVRYDGPDAPVGGARTTSKGKNAYLVVPNYNALQCGDTFTFSGWMHLTGGRWGNPLSRKTSPNEKSGWEMMQSGNSFSKFVALGQGGSGVTGEFNPGVDKAWAHFALVYSGSTVSVYGNGALLKSGAITAVNDNDKPLYIGNTGLADNHFVTGAFDELRLMKGAASADWVQAEYDTVAKANFLVYGASGPAWMTSSLDISGVAVVARGDSFVELSAMLHGLGENATEASIQLAYGFDETSLVKTQTVWTAKETGPMTLRLNRLLPQRVYCVQAVAVNDQGARAVSDPVYVMTAVSQDASGVAGLNQTFFTSANKDWTKSYAELPSGTDWRDYTNDYRIYRRELGVLAAYVGGNPGSSATKRRSEVWGDEVYWPKNGGQWVYWGQMRLEGGKSYRFRTHIDDNERVQVTVPSTGITTKLLEDVNSKNNIFTSDPFEPTETGWYPIEIRLSDGTGGAGGCTTTDGYLNTKNMGWSDDGGTTWKLMMDPGDGSLLRAGDLLAIRVDEVIADGELQKLKLTFPPAEEARDLYAAWGAQHGGATMNGWTHVQKLTTVESRCGTYEYTLPADWGTDDNRVIRFFLDGTPRSCSSSVYWRDCSEPLITGLSLDGRGGDTLKVTGSLASFAGSPCTLKVLIGQTPEALDQVWTELPGSGLQAPGAFDLTLFEDKTSPKYLAPGETYYVCVEATAGDSVSRSQVMQVTMAQADAIESATASVTRRTVKFSGILLGCGMGESESAKVSLWVGETDNAEEFVQAGEEQDKQGGKFSFEHTFPDFERTYYWQLRAVSTSAGGTAVVTTRTDVATCHTLDTTTYTWTGAADSDWGKRENWSDNQNGDSYGYPQSSAATAIFLASTKAQIVLRGEMSVGTLNLSAEGVDVTFIGAAGQAAEEAKPKLTVNQLKISGARLRLALDGVELYCSNDVELSASDSEVRLSNGAAWDLSSKTLSNFKGGTLWLDKGTSLTCSIYKFGGGLTVIDDATLKVRSSAVLGTNMDGGTIRFVGKQPAFLCSTQDVKVYSNRETANVRLEFALPVGGYQEPPFRNAYANPKFILGYYDGSQKKPHPITVAIARNSPAAIGLQKTNTTLISWGKGICYPEIIKPAAKPGANAEFVCSEETVGNNAYPVSLGVRLVPTGFIIRVR